MKVYYKADLDRRPFEGRTSIASKLKEFLQSKDYNFTEKIEEADLIHIHSSGIVNSYLAYKLKKKYKVPCIYSLYSNSKTEIINHFRNHFLERRVIIKGATSPFLSYSAVLPLKWRGLFLKKLDKVVVPSYYLKERLFKKNTDVIKFGINVNKFKPIKSKKENNKIKVAFFGHPGVFKGQIDFAKASKEFSAKIDSYMYFTKEIPKTVSYIKKINPKLNVYGYVDKIEDIYNQMDIIVLPYRSPLGAIANPLILLEAMSCGKPVITTNMPFLKEIVGNAAITVPPYNHKKLAKTVNWLAENEEAKVILGKRARRKITEHYNQEKMFKEYLSLYQCFEK